MTGKTIIDYTPLDQPHILSVLFHPRPELRTQPAEPPSCDVLIPVAESVNIGARFHLNTRDDPNILFFHGNGEIVADYNELGMIYNQANLNFLAVDYRGYGRSDGQPSVADMMQDCHTIFSFVVKWLQDNGYSGPMIVMGRSLGSASALELAADFSERIDGLVIESGFSRAGPLLQLLGINPVEIGFREEAGFRNLEKIKKFGGPTLIIHAEFDHIISHSEGVALFEASSSGAKKMLTVPNANHNDIFMRGFEQYLEAVKELSLEAISK
jgi:alpha-beta hydrolase superfamily lysophospholipase